MQPPRKRARLFVDLEASVANESEVETDGEDIPGDDLFDDSETITATVQSHLLEPPDDHPQEIIQAFLERARARATSKHDYDDEALGQEKAMTTLWRLKCLRNHEHDLLMRLLEVSATPGQLPGLASAFAHDHIPGWIYLEADHPASSTWSPAWSVMPWIIRSKGAPVLHAVPIEENRRTLKQGGAVCLDVGDWVELKAPGLYHLDVGYIAREVTPGHFAVLVVPRLEYLEFSAAPPRKLQTGERPDAALLDITRVPMADIEGAGDIVNLSWNGLSFESGLLVLSLQLHNLSPSTDIPSATATAFQLSRHPLLSQAILDTLPVATEWSFEKDEHVRVECDKMGWIRETAPSLVVELEETKELIVVYPPLLRKLFNVGDHVAIHGIGDGIVERLSENTANVLTGCGNQTEWHNVHVNLLRLIPSPLVELPSLPSITTPLQDMLPSSDAVQPRSRWLKKHVLIIRGEFKAHTGIVVADTGEKVQIRVDSYGPEHPFALPWVKYDCFDLCAPKLIPAISPPRPSTPVPVGSPGSISPAWNPHDSGPPGHLWFDDDVLSRQRSPTPPPAHWLLDKRLLGLSIRVKIKSREHRVWQEVQDGQRLIMREHYKQSIAVDLSEISVKHPTKNDFGRFLIHQGEHAGQHVRPVQWKEADNGSNGVIWTVKVVSIRGEGEEDLDIGPVLEILATDMILGWETSTSRRVNTRLASILRERATRR